MTRAQMETELLRCRRRLAIATDALSEISNPIVAMRERLEPDQVLDGIVALMLANDPGYSRKIAKDALEAINR